MEGFKQVFMVMWDELFNLTINLGENISFSLGQLMIAGFAFTLITEAIMHIFWGD